MHNFHVSGHERTVPHADFQQLMRNHNVVGVNMFGCASNAFKFAYQSYKTIFMNNINDHARQNVKKFLWCYLKANHPSYTKNQRKDFVKTFIAYLFDNKAPTNIPRACLLEFYFIVCQPSIDGIQPDDDIVNYMKNLFRGAERNNTFYRFVPHFIRMQHYIEDINIKNQENENASKKEKEQMRNFVVIPQYNWHRKHITINDNECLMSIANSLIPWGSPKWTRNDFNQVWDHIFNFGNSIRIQRSMGFNQLITTDGESVSVHFIKDPNMPADVTQTKQKHIGGNNDLKKTAITDAERNKFNNNEYDKIIGLDPGYKEMVAGCSINTSDLSESNIKVHSRVVRANTNWYQRKQKQRRITGKVAIV